MLGLFAIAGCIHGTAGPAMAESPPAPVEYVPTPVPAPATTVPGTAPVEFILETVPLQPLDGIIIPPTVLDTIETGPVMKRTQIPAGFEADLEQLLTKYGLKETTLDYQLFIPKTGETISGWVPKEPGDGTEPQRQNSFAFTVRSSSGRILCVDRTDSSGNNVPIVSYYNAVTNEDHVYCDHTVNDLKVFHDRYYIASNGDSLIEKRGRWCTSPAVVQEAENEFCD
jgi:hypothetical protein